MSPITNIDPDYDFWKMYPELKFIEEFQMLQEKYPNSSKIMWFIVLCFDLESKYRNLPLDERSSLLSKDYLKDKSFYVKNHTIIEPAVKRYENLADTIPQRQKRQLMETMEKRTKFLRETEYDLDNFEKLDKMAANTANLFKVLEVIEKQLLKDEGSGKTKADQELSLADSDDI